MKNIKQNNFAAGFEDCLVKDKTEIKTIMCKNRLSQCIEDDDAYLNYNRIKDPSRPVIPGSKVCKMAEKKVAEAALDWYVKNGKMLMLKGVCHIDFDYYYAYPMCGVEMPNDDASSKEMKKKIVELYRSLVSVLSDASGIKCKPVPDNAFALNIVETPGKNRYDVAVDGLVFRYKMTTQKYKLAIYRDILKKIGPTNVVIDVVLWENGKTGEVVSRRVIAENKDPMIEVALDNSIQKLDGRSSKTISSIAKALYDSVKSIKKTLLEKLDIANAM